MVTGMLEASCRDCGIPYTYDPQFFGDRNLAMPSRCAACRAQRRSSLEHGRIRHIDPRGYGFISADTGERFYFTLADFGGDVPPLHVGLRVQFLPSDGEPTRRARRIRAIEHDNEQTATTEDRRQADGL